MNIRPLRDRVVIKREPVERKSPGGIAIPGTPSEKPTFGKVIAVGRGKAALDNGQIRAPDGKVGDRVSSANTAAPRSKSITSMSSSCARTMSRQLLIDDSPY